MGIHHLNSPNWQGEGEYRLAFYEGQVYGLENTIICLFFVLIVLSMIKKILFGDAMKRQIPRQVLDRLVSQQYSQFDHPNSSQTSVSGTTQIATITTTTSAIVTSGTPNPMQQSQKIRTALIQSSVVVDTDEDLGFVASRDGTEENALKKYVKRHSFCQKTFSFFIILLLWSIGICAAYMFSLTSGFGQVELGPGIMSCLMLYFIILYFSFRSGVNLPCLGLLFILAVLCSVLPLVFFQDICVCSNSESGFLVNNGQYLSTSFTRKYQLEKACEEFEICHAFATLSEDSMNTVVINIHTGIGIDSIRIVFFDVLTSTERFSSVFEYNVEAIELDKHGERHIYAAVITGLDENRNYDVSIYDNTEYSTRDNNNNSNDGSTTINNSVNLELLPLLKKLKYRTLPSKQDLETGKATVKIAFAGDWAPNTYTGLLNQRLLTANPDVLIFGGNVAMDNGMKNCYHAWDLFLWNFETRVFELNEGRLIPMVIATGNRDVGINSMKGFNATVSPDLGPLLFSWIPQTIQLDTATLKQVPMQLQARKSHHVHLIGNIALFVLDSGYLSDFDGEQLDWMKIQADKYQEYYKLAVYHYPIYPSCLKADPGKWDSPWSSKIAEESWVPFFDSENFIAAFESHQKQFKRTFAMKARTHHAAGTVYFGDANQSDETSTECTKPAPVTGIFEKTSTIGNLQHFWILKFEANTVHFDALSKDPKYSLDKDFTLDLTPYKRSQVNN